MRLATWLPLVAALAGCALQARPDRSTFFALAASEPAEAVSAGSWDVTLGIGPVAIPGYLDRPQLVSRVAPNELSLAPEARWAEPLREGIARALQQNVAAASGARSVALYPWPITTHVDLAVAVEVLRFEPGADGAVELAARWNVRETTHGRVLVVRETRLSEPVDGAGNGPKVAALSRALGQLGGELATALRDVKLPPRR